METPKNTKQSFMGDTATADIPVNSFQKPQVVEKVVNVKSKGSLPNSAGIKTPGPND